MTSATTITTSDGERLEAELTIPDDPAIAVVITHPHPLMGGDMYTPVPGAFWRALPARQAAGIRFNFRGVGRSTGTHDEGRAERLDVAAAIDALAEAAPAIPIVAAGWSFGADVSLAVDDARIAGWYLAAAPLRVVDPAEMAARTSAAPKHFATGENDQFTSSDHITATTRTWPNTSVTTVPGADHFFGIGMDHLVAGFESFLASPDL